MNTLKSSIEPGTLLKHHDAMRPMDGGKFLFYRSSPGTQSVSETVISPASELIKVPVHGIFIVLDARFTYGELYDLFVTDGKQFFWVYSDSVMKC
jgi:hypothetical protein